MFYFPLVQNIYNISYMYRGVPQLESRMLRERRILGADLSIQFSVKPAFKAQQVTMKGNKGTGCLNTRL